MRQSLNIGRFALTQVCPVRQPEHCPRRTASFSPIVLAVNTVFVSIQLVWVVARPTSSDEEPLSFGLRREVRAISIWAEGMIAQLADR